MKPPSLPRIANGVAFRVLVSPAKARLFATLCCVSIAWALGAPALCAPALDASASAAEPLTNRVERGPVTATVRLEPSEPVIGDTLTLTVEVRAEKGVELLMPEFGDALESFSIVDFVPRETIDDQGRTVATQKYRIQPPLSGRHAIPPILVEFVDRRSGQQPAPDGLDAYELLTERIEFEVASVLPDDATAELKPPLGELPPLSRASQARWPWIVGGLLALAVFAPLALRAFWAWRRRARRRSAYEIARGRLERLLASPRAREQIGVFYVELSAIVRRYLEDRFELRAPELTTEEFLDSVQQAPVLSPAHQTLLREFLRQADLVKFAGLQPLEDDVQRSIDAAGRFLEETRENAPLIDESAAAAAPHPVSNRESSHV